MADPFLDAIGVSIPGAGSSGASGSAKTFPITSPLDAAIRTVVAEEADPTARKWVAGVIANRAREGKKALDAVVAEPNQFEGYGRATEIDPGSDDYKSAAKLVTGILQGKDPDPSGGAMQFYAPEAQASLGRQKPEWDDGKGVKVGKTLFFGGKGQAPDAFLTSLGVDLDAAESKPAPELTKSQTVTPPAKNEPAQPFVFSEGGGAPNAEQQASLKALYLGGGLDVKAPSGSPMNPLVRRGEQDDLAGLKAGDYYVDLNGRMQKVGGPDKSSFIAGAFRGVGDVPESVYNLLPGHEESDVRNTLEAWRLRYGADYGGDLKSGLGRFTGQVAASAPIIAAAEAAAAPALMQSTVGRFLLGRAGSAQLPAAAGAMERLAQLGVRGGSLGTAGALEGGAGTALVSSASDQPVPDQMKAGMILGGALRPAGAAVQGGLRRFVGGAPLAGAASLGEQQAMQAAAQGLPVPVPLSRGQMTGAPAAQMTENALLRGAEGDKAAEVLQAFRGDQQAALRGNVEAIAGQMGGRAVSRGEGGVAVSERLNTLRDAAKSEIDAAYDAARAQGENAQLAGAQAARDFMLNALRKDYDLRNIEPVAREVEAFGSGGAPTAREIFDARTRLSNLRTSSDQVTAGAAGKAVDALDGYIDKALTEDLLLGDPAAVKAWREAIGKRRAFGKLFEGDDLIENLTAREPRSGRMQLVVDPQQATDYILNRSALGFVGKKNLGRDLSRMREVLGADSPEWNGLRAEVFLRIARAGEGVPERGEAQFSGQNFLKAWQKANADDPQVMGVMFTPDERKLIGDFAEVAQRVTTPVKGGDNPSNTAITAKRFLGPLMAFLAPTGGAAGGAVFGGPVGAAGGAALGALLKDLGEVMAASKARRLTYGAKPVKPPSVNTRLVPASLAPVAGAVALNPMLGDAP